MDKQLLTPDELAEIAEREAEASNGHDLEDFIEQADGLATSFAFDCEQITKANSYNTKQVIAQLHLGVIMAKSGANCGRKLVLARKTNAALLRHIAALEARTPAPATDVDVLLADAEHWARLTRKLTSDVEQGCAHVLRLATALCERGQQLAEVTRERDAATARADAFKAYVHKRLDDAGIPSHPDGPHSKEGCRVGDRLDIALCAENTTAADLAQEVECLKAEKEALREEAEDGLEDTPAARAVMGAFWEGSRLAFQRFAPCGTPWKDYDHFRESAWRDSDSRANILHPTSTVEEAISRSMGEHWAVVATKAEQMPASVNTAPATDVDALLEEAEDGLEDTPAARAVMGANLRAELEGVRELLVAEKARRAELVVLAKEAYMEGHNDHRCVGDAIDTAWSNSRTRKALEGGAQ